MTKESNGSSNTLNGVKVHYKKSDPVDKNKQEKGSPRKDQKKFAKRFNTNNKAAFTSVNVSKEKKLTPNPLLKNPRFCAIQIVHQVMEGVSLTESLSGVMVELTPQDKRFTQHLVYGTLRLFDRICDQLNQLMSKPIKASEREVHYALILALYEISEMATAEYALVNNWVNLIKKMNKLWAVGLVNGVLRGVLRSGLPIPKTKNGVLNMPAGLTKILINNWGEEKTRLMAAFFETHPAMTLRVNLLQTTVDQYLEKLNLVGILGVKHAFVPTAIVLENPVNVTDLPDFSEGAVSVQDASAQLASIILNPKDNDYILDACAAPGGKTLALLEQYTNIKRVVALDSSESRLARVNENVVRIFGAPHPKLTLEVSACEDFKTEELFDAILLDVPCSATGIMQRHPDIKRHRKASDIDQFCDQQRTILEHAWRLLKPRGRLLYATCSILRQENEAQMISFFEHHADASEIPLTLAIGERQEKGIQILPKITESNQKMDGFYYCLLEKNGEA